MTTPAPHRARHVGAASRSTLTTLLAALLAVVAPATAGAQGNQGNQGAQGTAAPAEGTGGTLASSSLRPGDALRLRIWQEPELSGEFTIDETGVVNLPKIGLVQAAGTPLGRLKDQIIASYRVYVTQPIELTPLFRIRVAGAVRTPGLYRVDPTMTIADALALAGGTSAAGRADRVRLVRGGQVVVARLTPDASLADSPLRSGDQLLVPERSWISQNPGVVIGAISAAATILWTLRRR